MTLSRKKDRIEQRRREKERKRAIMRRKGAHTEPRPGPHHKNRSGSYLCGPCSASKKVQVRHKFNSVIGRAHFSIKHDSYQAYKLPMPKAG